MIYTFAEVHTDTTVLSSFLVDPDKAITINSLLNTPISSENTLIIITHVEAEAFLNCHLDSPEAIEHAAMELISYGAQSVFIRAVDLHHPSWNHDYWTNGQHSFWLTQKQYSEESCSNVSAIFATATAAALTLGYTVQDALIIAKMYVHRGIRKGGAYFHHGAFPEEQADIPYLASVPLYEEPKPFRQSPYLGLYPVVDSAQWVETLLSYGVKTVQLRIKKRSATLIDEIKKSIALAKKHQALLFINDYWDLALEFGAEAVHLGQEDIETADLSAIQKQGLLLGVSTYCYYEVARAHALCPSYIAIGPIYPTTSKELAFPAQGLDMLQRWQRTLHYPLVAIGGISIERAAAVVATGVQGVALISAITQADDPQMATKQLLSLM